MADTTRTPSMPRSGGAAKETTVVREVEGQAMRAVAETKELGSEAMAAVRDSATTFYEEQRDRAATEIAAVGNLLCSSVQLLDRNGGAVGHYAGDAGREINRFADRLRTRSWSELCSDVEGFARANPMFFMAAAAGAGFVAARVLAASANQPIGETPMQSSMALLKETSGQVRDALRGEPTSAPASMAEPATIPPTQPAGMTRPVENSTGPNEAPGSGFGTTGGSIGGPGRR